MWTWCAPVALTLLFLSCRDAPSELRETGVAENHSAYQAPPAVHLRADGSHFVGANGRRFDWRGITAFRLLDHEADGRHEDVDRFLTWATQQGLTVVRVLAMGDGFLDLQPADGRRALPALLRRAARHGLHVEVVALASTATVAVDLDAHVVEIGRILAVHGNGLLEIANEAVHPSQRAEIQNPDALKALASKVPEPVPGALSSIERGEGFGLGDYVTWHSPRDEGFEGWGHVVGVAEGARLVNRWKKPVVSDEPIGAGDRSEPGHRDDRPERFRAAAALTGLAGLGATFHYEGGLQAVVPAGRQLECFAAWMDGLRIMGAVPDGGRFVEGTAISEIARVTGARAVFARVWSTEAWLLLIDPSPTASVSWQSIWRNASATERPGMTLWRASRTSAGLQLQPQADRTRF